MPQNATDPSGVTDIGPDIRERGLGIARGLVRATGADTKGSTLEQAIHQHHQQRLDEARMQKQNASTYASILMTGIDPATGQPLSPEQKQQYENWYNSSITAYEKVAGVNKETKGAIAKSKDFIGRILHLKRQQGGAGQQQGIPPPPGAQAAAPAGDGTGYARFERGYMAPQVEGPSTEGKAPSAGISPPPSAQMAAMGGPAIEEQRQDTRAFSFWKKQQELLKQYKIEEGQAAAQAKAAYPTSRPVIGPAISVSNARTLALQGKTFLDKDGNPIDLTAMPDSMGLKNIIWGGKSYYEPFSPNQKVITVGNETYAISPMDVSALGGGAGTDIGQHTVPTTTSTTDPTTGLTTRSKHVPETRGAIGRGATPSQATPAQTPAPTKTPGRISAPPSAGQRTAPDKAGVPPLDAEGHIPANYPGATPQVVEGANQLLDGMDVNKIRPPKVSALSAQLARKYGWEQGKFTPKEQVMLREATTFLKRAAQDPSLAVLDRGTMSRMKLTQNLHADPAKEGVVGRTLDVIATQNLDEQEAAFARMYNQLVGTISGLALLVRSGRATEATIHRLMLELPSPAKSQSAADARQRIQRILSEVDVAMEKGTFTGEGSKKGMISPPPSAPKSIDDEIMKAIHHP